MHRSAAAVLERQETSAERDVARQLVVVDGTEVHQDQLEVEGLHAEESASGINEVREPTSTSPWRLAVVEDERDDGWQRNGTRSTLGEALPGPHHVSECLERIASLGTALVLDDAIDEQLTFSPELQPEEAVGERRSEGVVDEGAIDEHRILVGQLSDQRARQSLAE